MWYARFVREPWRLLLGVSAAVLALSYIAVALIALWRGSADFAFPLKTTLVFTILLSFYWALDEIRQILMVKHPRVIPRLHSLVLFFLGYAIAATAIAGFLVSTSLSFPITVDLTVKVMTTLGLGAPAVFSLVELYRGGELLLKVLSRVRH